MLEDVEDSNITELKELVVLAARQFILSDGTNMEDYGKLHDAVNELIDAEDDEDEEDDFDPACSVCGGMNC